jgi:hypothetical protein
VKVIEKGYETWEGDVVVKVGERVEGEVELKVKKRGTLGLDRASRGHDIF